MDKMGRIDKTEKRPELKGTNILLVDQDEYFCRKAARIFSFHEAIFTAMNSIETGLEALRNGHYDLILSSLFLPQTLRDFEKILLLRKELQGCHEIFQQQQEADPDDEEFQDRLEAAKQDRRHILGCIAPLLRKEGCIEMLKQWASGPRSRDTANTPIVMVPETELSEGCLDSLGLEVSGIIIKPFSEGKLLDTCVKAIE